MTGGPSTTMPLLLLLLGFAARGSVAVGDDPRASEAVLALHRVIASAVVDVAGPVVLPLLDVIGNARCRNETRAVLDGLSTSLPWAARMADSWGRAPAGVLSGSEYSFGNFDECVQVVSRTSEVGGTPDIRGQYCLVDVTLDVGQPRGPHHQVLVNGPHHQVLVNGPDGHKYVEARNGRNGQYTLHCGVCIPSGCTARDLKAFLSRALLQAGNGVRARVDVSDGMCHREKPAELHLRDIAFLSFVGLYSVILLIGTVYSHVKTSNEKGLLGQVLLAFSLTRNMTKLGRYKPSDLGLDCLFGLKFIFMTFILMGHSLLFQLGGPIFNDDNVEKQQKNILTDLYKNNQLFVDGFFLIGGFLMCRMMLQELDKKKKINVTYIIALRYFRLTPPYAVIIAFYATVFYYVGSGPLWDSRIGLERDRCLSSWWANLLYVNNYVNSGTTCMFQSWYVAADLQLFVAGLPLVYALWRWPTVGGVLASLLLVLSVVASFVSTLLAHLDPLLMMFRRDMEDVTLNIYFENIYTKTHFKATPYLVGILLGYIVYHFQMKGIKLKRATLWTGWAASGALGTACMFSANVFYQRGYRYRALDAAFFAALDKLGWCTALSWLVFACATKHAGILDGFLSSRWLVPFSRISYSAYLVNGIVTLYSVGSARVPTFFEEASLLQILLSQFMLTYSAGLLLTLTFESPLNALQKILLPGRRETSEGGGKVNS